MSIKNKPQEIKRSSVLSKDLVDFDYFNQQFTIHIFDPSKKEIAEYKDGAIILKLAIDQPILFIVFKIGSIEWSDIAYSICNTPEKLCNEYKKKLKKNFPRNLHLKVIDRKTKEVKVERTLKLNPKFAEKLRDAVLNQCECSETVEDCLQTINTLFKKYDSQQLSLSNLVRATSKIPSKRKTQYREVKVDAYGWETNKKVPDWVYKYVHNPKTNDNKGTIPKRFIPQVLQQKGIIKCTYAKKQGRHLYAEVFKLKKIRKR